MIEAFVYGTLGFLAAGVIGLGLMPLVHHRAVRLTMKRLEHALPLSLADVQAEKDRMRAEHAVATRNLEMALEAQRAKVGGHMAETGRKAEEVRRLREELARGGLAREDVEAREGALRAQLGDAERALAEANSRLSLLETRVVGGDAGLADARAEHEAALAWMTAERNREVAQLTAERDREIARLMAERDRAVGQIDELRVELAALRTQQEKTDAALMAAEREAETSTQRLIEEREWFAAARRDLAAWARRDGEWQAHVQALEARIARIGAGTDPAWVAALTAERDGLKQRLAALEAENQGLRETARAGDAALRARIEDIAGEMLRHFGEAGDPNGGRGGGPAAPAGGGGRPGFAERLVASQERAGP